MRSAVSGLATAALVAVSAAGCGGPEPGALPQGDESVAMKPSDFTTEIDNQYWPMEPGTRWTYDEVDDEGRTMKVVVTVTSVTRKVANGVSARVVRDSVSADGILVEDTFDWYAQHRDGTIWYLGEDTAEFEKGKVSSREGSFEAGVDGALAGVIMPAKPAVGMKYRQEFYEGEAEDNGEILSVSEIAEVPAGQFEDVLLTRDTIAFQPEILEYKLYAKGVGPVLKFGVSGGGGRETLTAKSTVSAAVAKAAGVAPLGQGYG